MLFEVVQLFQRFSRLPLLARLTRGHVTGENEEELGGEVTFGAGRSASESQEEGVAALGAVHGVIFVVEVQDVFLSFEAKLLVQQHGRVAGRHVQRYVFPHTRLKTSTEAPVTGHRAASPTLRTPTTT